MTNISGTTISGTVFGGMVVDATIVTQMDAVATMARTTGGNVNKKFGDFCLDEKGQCVHMLSVDSKITVGPASIFADVSGNRVLSIDASTLKTNNDIIPMNDKVNLGSLDSPFKKLFVDDIIIKSADGHMFKLNVTNDGILTCKAVDVK